MIRFVDYLGGDPVTVNYVQSKPDMREVRSMIREHDALALDTESTGLNVFHRDWYLRLFQLGHRDTSYVIPASRPRWIEWVLEQDMHWLAHNGPHDIRSLDSFLGYETGIRCEDTYIPAHHHDSRQVDDGGHGLSLEELAVYFVDRDAKRYEKQLKKEFGKLTVPTDQVYKSDGKYGKKGERKYRRALMSEGWRLIPEDNEAYIVYAGMDPIFTYRVWQALEPMRVRYAELNASDHRDQEIADTLQRRGFLLDVQYTQKLHDRLNAAAERHMAKAKDYGCDNVYSTKQVAETLIRLGANLKVKTKTQQWKMTDDILKDVQSRYPGTPTARFVYHVLTAKRLHKRASAYAKNMLDMRDENDRVHASINALKARTGRQSVDNPAMQQLPSKDS